MDTMPRFGQTLTVLLPSGVKVKARRLSLISLLKADDFPLDLTGLVWKMANSTFDPEKELADPTSFKKMAQMIDEHVRRALKVPAVSAVTDLKFEDGVMVGTWAVEDMPDLDKQYIFLFSRGLLPAVEEMPPTPKEEVGDAEAVRPADLHTFREGGAGADAGPGGESVSPTSVEPGRDSA